MNVRNNYEFSMLVFSCFFLYAVALQCSANVAAVVIAGRTLMVRMNRTTNWRYRLKSSGLQWRQTCRRTSKNESFHHRSGRHRRHQTTRRQWIVVACIVRRVTVVSWLPAAPLYVITSSSSRICPAGSTTCHRRTSLADKRVTLNVHCGPDGAIMNAFIITGSKILYCNQFGRQRKDF